MKIQVYTISHEDLAPVGVGIHAEEAFLRWASKNGAFANIKNTSMELVTKARAIMYPEPKLEGMGWEERAADAVATISPFHLSLYVMDVMFRSGEEPRATSLVAVVGEHALAALAGQNIDHAIEYAAYGCSIFDVGQIADGCDGFTGLFRDTVEAAANLPDTDMTPGELFRTTKPDVALIVHTE